MEKINYFSYYKNKKILITGGFGFKGSLLAYLLTKMGAIVKNYSLHSNNSFLFNLLFPRDTFSTLGDILDFSKLNKVVNDFTPEIIFHLAAQPLVSYSYENPILTYNTNVMGTLHLLESIRNSKSVKTIVNITTDKVYKNNHLTNDYAFVESDSLNGEDPYSNSKSLADIASESFHKNFLPHVKLFNVRSGNVIGGGDRSKNRISTDLFNYFSNYSKDLEFTLRSPNSTRPYMHFLDTLIGYLLLPLNSHKLPSFSSFNFGPMNNESITTLDFIREYEKSWELPVKLKMINNPIKESSFLSLNSHKANVELGWRPRFTIKKAIEETVNFEKAILQKEAISFLDNLINKYLKE